MSDLDPAETAARFQRGLRLGTLCVLATVLLGWHLPTLIAARARYRPLWLEVSAMTVLIGILITCAVVVTYGRPWGRLRWPLAAAALAASAAATGAVAAPDLIGGPHWSWEAFGWFAVVIFLDRPVVLLAGILSAHLAITAAQVVLAGRSDVLPGVAIVTLVVGGWQVVVGLMAAALRRAAATATSLAAQAERLRTGQATANWLRRDRSARYAELSDTAIPLLAGLSDGTLNPADQGVRRACAAEAARLRRLFAEHDKAADPLRHELLACVDAAQRLGLTVEFECCGEAPLVPQQVRRALTDATLNLLVQATTAARVTLDAVSEQVVLSVVAEVSDHETPRAEPADGEPVQVRWLTTGRLVWMEASWNPKS